MGFSEVQAHRSLFDFGAHLGIAFQVHDDILDFTQSEAQLGKPAFNDLKEGIVTAPIIYALLEQQERDRRKKPDEQQTPHLSNAWLEAVERNFADEADVQAFGKPMLELTSGLERADSLSIHHIELAVENLRNLKRDKEDSAQVFGNDSSSAGANNEEEHYQALIGLALKVKTRKH